jgi:hypothetical protein
MGNRSNTIHQTVVKLKQNMRHFVFGEEWYNVPEAIGNRLLETMGQYVAFFSAWLR